MHQRIKGISLDQGNDIELLYLNCCFHVEHIPLLSQKLKQIVVVLYYLSDT